MATGCHNQGRVYVILQCMQCSSCCTEYAPGCDEIAGRDGFEADQKDVVEMSMQAVEQMKQRIASAPPEGLRNDIEKLQSDVEQMQVCAANQLGCIEEMRLRIERIDAEQQDVVSPRPFEQMALSCIAIESPEGMTCDVEKLQKEIEQMTQHLKHMEAALKSVVMPKPVEQMKLSSIAIVPCSGPDGGEQPQHRTPQGDGQMGAVMTQPVEQMELCIAIEPGQGSTSVTKSAGGVENDSDSIEQIQQSIASNNEDEKSQDFEKKLRRSKGKGPSRKVPPDPQELS